MQIKKDVHSTVTTQNSSSKLKKQQEKELSDNISLNHSATFDFRDDISLSHKPPANTLSELVYNNNYIELEKKLKKNPDPNIRDNEGATYSWTPLYWSVKLRRVECIKLLLNYGGNINLVINDCEECCGTVLDLCTLRGDDDIEALLREFAEREDVNLGQSFKAIRTKLRGKAPAFNFRYQGKKAKLEAA